MKLQHLLNVLFLLIPVFAVAQNIPEIEVSYERSSKGEVTFYAANSSYSPYTVSLTFTKLSGTSSFFEGDTHKITVRRGKTRLTTLRPSSEDSGVGFAYSYTYSKGSMRAKTDSNFVYLFPLLEGKRVRMNRMVSLENVLGSDKKTRLTGIAFRTTEGDTIVAARYGLVTEVRDNSASTSDHKAFDRNENFVEVYQEDGTFVRYMLFQDSGVFVVPGENVIPGQPLGVIGGSNYEGGSHLRISILCPDMKDVTFVPNFYLSSGNTGKPEEGELYVSEHPQELIMQEMSKKEKKAFLEKQ